MDRETFDRAAARFERLAARHPARYRLLVVGLGAGGLAFVGLWVAAGLALLGGAVLLWLATGSLLVVPVGLGAVAFLVAIARAAWIPVERPAGVLLTPERAPRLFAELERLRALGRAPRLDRVLVDDRLDAGVWQTPRLGLLGLVHDDLVLGYPILAALSTEELRAVLAHELAHLARRHGRTGAWAHRVRATWARILAALVARRSLLSGVFRRFLASYGPWFEAATLALAREQEREADHAAARATGTRTAADALVATRLAGSAIERFYLPALRRSAALEPVPPERHLEALEPELRRGMADAGAHEVLRQALLERSGSRDTHPALAERLAALGEVPRIPPRPARSAAEELLGEGLPEVRAELERRWRAGVASTWAQLHAEAARGGRPRRVRVLHGDEVG